MFIHQFSDIFSEFYVYKCNITCPGRPVDCIKLYTKVENFKNPPRKRLIKWSYAKNNALHHLKKSWHSHTAEPILTRHSSELPQVNCIEIVPSVWVLQCPRKNHIHTHTDIEVKLITLKNNKNNLKSYIMIARLTDGILMYLYL